MHQRIEDGTHALSYADFETIVDSIPEIVWTAAPDGSPEYLNRRGAEYTGLPEDARPDWDWIEMVHPEDADRTADKWRDAVANGTPYEVEFRLRRFDVEFRRHVLRALPVRNADGELVRWVGTATDVEDRRLSDQRLEESERRSVETAALLETLQSNAPVGFGFCDRDFRMVRMNEALAAINGIPVERQLGRTIAEAVPELWSQVEPIYTGVLETKKPVINLETSGDLPGDPGKVHTWLSSLYPVCPEGEEVIGIGFIVVDITERKAMEVRLKELSERDQLTGIYNRRRFLLELERAIASDARYGHAGAVLLLDIDNFKLINDSYGRAVGDSMLKSVAQVLTARLRKTDFAARIGGDGFAIILPEVTGEEALTVAVDVRSRLNERPSGPPVQVSIGIALLGEDKKLTVDDLLAAADNAMYQSKETGGDQATVYEGPVGEVLSRVRDIQEALEEDRFVLYSQPIIDLKSGCIAFRELLIRMRSKAGEIIPPAGFLGLAEEFSLMGQIDHWVLGEALGLAHHEPVTVNLSARSVGDLGILAPVRQAISAGLDPHHLTFEITETAAMADFDRAVAFATSLKDMGCELALDDFGTGFGTFTYLKRLPARYLKIDMEFVRGIKDDLADEEIVRSIVRIAHALGKETIAEGIEDEGVLEKLREIGVDYAQGWHLGMPEPTNDAAAE